jgi:hypothetical protein
MVVSLPGLGPESDSAGKAQWHLDEQRPILSSGRTPHIKKPAIVRQ